MNAEDVSKKRKKIKQNKNEHILKKDHVVTNKRRFTMNAAIYCAIQISHAKDVKYVTGHRSSA